MSKNQGGHESANPKVLWCSCKNEYQDQKYGPQMRVHNPARDKQFRCTVCGKVKQQ